MRIPGYLKTSLLILVVMLVIVEAQVIVGAHAEIRQTEVTSQHRHRHRRAWPWVRLPKVEVKIPEIRLPDVTIPEIHIPDLPQVEIPEIRVPDVKIPEIEIPEITVPEIQIPELNVKVPKMKIPESRIPEIQIPKVVIPEVSVPDIDNMLREISERFDRYHNGRLTMSSPLLEKDWVLTWGWFDQPEAGSEVIEAENPRQPPLADSPRTSRPRPLIPKPKSDHHETSRVSLSYDTLCRGRHYSARRYKSSAWINTHVENGTSMDALRRIKEYFKGQNIQGRVMPMSRPLRMTVTGVNGTISDHEHTMEEFTLSALVPTRMAPEPTDPMLSLSYEPRQMYFSTPFRRDRRPGTPAIYDEFFELRDALDLAGESFQKAIYHAAFYETWADVTSDHSRPQTGEILIPASSVKKSDDLICRQRGRIPRPQNGIQQCGHSRCPTYEHLDQLRDDIELRRIKSATYITKKARSCTLVLPAFVSHLELSKYITGDNTENERYPSPAPFIHYVFPSPLARSLCKQTSVSAFMLPTNITAAQPLQKDLRIRTIPDREAYVIKFGGRPNARTVESKVDELRDFLRQKGLCFVRDRYAVAVYDHPFNRPPYLNEVLVFKKSGRRCQYSEFEEAIGEDTPRENMASTSTTSSMEMTTPTTSPSEVENETSTVATATSVGTTTRAPGRLSTRRPTEDYGLIEDNFLLIFNSVDQDFIPYRFSGNQTDFPEDFPVDVFVY